MATVADKTMQAAVANVMMLRAIIGDPEHTLDNADEYYDSALAQIERLYNAAKKAQKGEQ